MATIDESSKISITVKSLWIIAVFLITTLIPIIISVDGLYAHADTVNLNSDKIKSIKMSFEQSQNAMRLDIIDDRIDREKYKPIDRQDQRKIDKLENQYNKLEARQLLLDAQQLKHEMDHVHK